MAETRVAGYVIEAEIGHGGMAVVYRAHDLKLGRTVALKLLDPALARSDTFRQRFVHEQHVAAAIDHPHIVPVFEAGEWEGTLFIAMRWVPGRDLQAVLNRNGPLDPATAARIILQVASALDAAHAHGLVHRDVKPGNILVAEGIDRDHPEHVYLTDFGITKKALSQTGLTSYGHIVGTHDYMAPEQIKGEPVDHRCDIYSLGCVAFATLTGSPLFRRDSDDALLDAHKEDPPPSLAELREGLPEAADAVLARALAKLPQDRYDSCLDFATDFQAALTAHHAPAPTPQPAPPVPAPPPPSTEPPAWARPVFHRAF
ncbi:serine/threonine-protein kinase [Streptomyces sp. NPDC090025]|uniref:serine/threonine-protein kinase n=1 Tax=Streptomyces sp. NPDC090025 TaxID=3365922 RepID=UPI0038338D62